MMDKITGSYVEMVFYRLIPAGSLVVFLPDECPELWYKNDVPVKLKKTPENNTVPCREY